MLVVNDNVILVITTAIIIITTQKRHPTIVSSMPESPSPVKREIFASELIIFLLF